MNEILQQVCGIAFNKATPGAAGYALAVFSVITLALVCICTVVFLVRPGETRADHIKRRVLRDEFHEDR